VLTSPNLALTKCVSAFFDSLWIGRVHNKDNGMALSVVPFPNALQIRLPAQILEIDPCSTNVNPANYF